MHVCVLLPPSPVCVQTVAPSAVAYRVDYKRDGLVPDWDVGVARVRCDPILKPEEMTIVTRMILEGTEGRLERGSDDEEDEEEEEGEGGQDGEEEEKGPGAPPTADAAPALPKEGDA